MSRLFRHSQEMFTLTCGNVDRVYARQPPGNPPGKGATMHLMNKPPGQCAGIRVRGSASAGIRTRSDLSVTSGVVLPDVHVSPKGPCHRHWTFSLARGPRLVLLSPLPRTGLLPSLVTDGFGQGRLRVYMNHAPLPRRLSCRSQTALTGSGSHRSSYGGYGGGHPHFHPHAGCSQPDLTSPAARPALIIPWPSVASSVYLRK